MKLANSFSEVYHRLLPDLMETDLVNETWANCSNCHHCEFPNLERYHTKCCDYHPSLPNFIVGAILSTDTPDMAQGRAIIERKIKDKKGVTPYGITAPLEYQIKFKKDRLENTRRTPEDRKSLRCPFYDSGSGGCSIYKYRSDLCGNHQCMTVSPAHGKAFWKNLTSFTRNLDLKLALNVMHEMGVNTSGREIKKLKETVSLLENSEDSLDSGYEGLWKSWQGKEADYYKQCFQVFSRLSSSSLTDIMGDDFSKEVEEVVSLSAKSNDSTIPELLIFDEQRYQELISDTPLSTTKNPLNLLMFRLFDGKRTTYEIVRKAMILEKPINKFLQAFITEGVLKEEIKTIK
jgi:Fe-S-cluster containining protein